MSHVPPQDPYTGPQPAAGPGQWHSGAVPTYQPFEQQGSPPALEPPRRRMSPQGRVLLTWAIIGVMLLVTALAAIAALNRDVYGAGAFVGRYIETLAAKDATAALEIPGVTLDEDALASAGLPGGSSDLLLRSETLGELTEIEQISETDLGDGVHEVRFSYRADGTYSESTFTVRSAGTQFPLLPRWEFAESPLAVVNLAVQHTTSFSVNGFDVDTRQATGDEESAAFDNIVNLQVFAPARYEIRIDTGLLTSADEQVVVDEPSRVHEAVVTGEPTEELVQLVQDTVNTHLDECTEQEVLQPTGCPFGMPIEDRVAAPPTWSIDEYPEIALEPGETTWEIPLTEGDASIDVDVQSLFDGSVQSLDDNVPFQMTGQVYVQGDGSVDVQLEAVGQ